MAKFIGFVVGAVEIGVGIATGNPALIVSGVLTEASSAAALLLAPKMKAQQAQATTLQLGEVSRQGVFGEAATAGSLVDGFNFGGKYGTGWTVLVMAIADHLCEELVGFYVNDKFVPFVADGAVAGFKDQLQVFWRSGSWDQAVPAILTDNCPVVGGKATWTAADRGRGVAYVVVAYKADKATAKHPVWSNGRPQFTWVVKGLRSYSAREDASVGGAGAHRWDDPTTREWSENPIDCRYTWVRGIYAGDKVGQPEMLLLGRGLSDVEAPPDNVFAPANLCDEAVPRKGVLSGLTAAASAGDHTIALSTVDGLAAGTSLLISQEGFNETLTVSSIAGLNVTLTGGLSHAHPALTTVSWAAAGAAATEPRYRIGGVFGGDDAYIDTENDFAAACGGWIVEREGSVELVPGAAQPVVWNITDDDLIVGSTATATDFRSVTDEAWCNTVAAKYVEPAQQWKDHSAPVRRVVADVLADGKPRVAQPSLALCTSGTQAQRVAEQQRRMGRLWLQRGLTLGPRFIGAEHGDWLSWSSNRYHRRGTAPGTPIILRIESDGQDEKWQNTLALREVSADVFGWNAPIDELPDGAVALQADAPDFSAAADGWTVSGETLTSAGGSIPALLVSGAAPDDAEAILFELRIHADGQADDDGWSTVSTDAASTTRKDITGVTPGTAYDVGISYRVGLALGDRLIVGPVTAGDLVAGGAATATSLGGIYGAPDITSILDRLHSAGVSGF